MLELPPLALYIHIPWCVRKCPYCDFNSHQAGTELPEDDYVGALERDLAEGLEGVQGRRLSSIFIGGGTPSLFSPAAIGRVLAQAEARIGFQPDIEITLEANPGTFEQEKFSGFRSAGVNRLSIGIQSFSDLHLQQLGRIHGRAEALAAVAMARRAGFHNINLDLMHGLPGQSPADASRDLQTAIELEPTHLSWYQLTIEPNTEFYSRPPPLPVDDALADIQQCGEQLLAAAGFQQYEVSAYARPRQRSRHNLNYWQFGDYLGIGAGAHAKITLLPAGQPGHVLRQQKTRMPAHYLDQKRPFIAQQGPVDEADLTLEFMMNALRLLQGVDANLFPARTGLPATRIAGALQSLRQRGLLVAAPERIQTSPTGMRFLNEVLAEFMPG
ncbi:MAG: radical SAM family heme chaperone HemW [Gammaproteobacteria bacterium]|uniref:radical SAM family heme chaperone HemW n=1 Tax=Pseudomaricurvus alcaniphilus TaxID=1166482 RepID=UPI00140CCE2D|nr:radical SAM family heme chaperone HemW [Pseudomaricurvus alcaniphilus]MBR9909869.1 radical SAM family heme chaperone HemW [Gammaproteobacteria bacterium]NHN38595.1 radical SAM family heme chaperone HemW [Pseudomaricurvus alcaniphilus]